MTLRIMTLCIRTLIEVFTFLHLTERKLKCQTKCQLFTYLLSVIMLGVILVSAIMLSVLMLSVIMVTVNIVSVILVSVIFVSVIK